MLQILWKSTNKMGCGLGKYHNGVYLVVCNFDSHPKIGVNTNSNFPIILQDDIKDAMRQYNNDIVNNANNQNNRATQLKNSKNKRS